MKAVAANSALALTLGDSACLVDIDLPEPTPGPHDLLVKVEAVSVNPLDTKMRRVPPKSGWRVLGWDAAGTVVGCGAAVSHFHIGDAVYYAGSIQRPGCNSELHLVDERLVGPKPATLTFAAAAALPLTAITAWESLFDRLHIARDGSDAGKRILILGGAGGVGSMAIQLAKTLAQLTVVASASRAESRRWCLDLGADQVVDHSGDWLAPITASGAVDYVLCLNDIDQHFERIAQAVAAQGKICAIVDNKKPLPMEKLKAKSASFAWESMFTRSLYATADLIEQQRILASVAAAVDAGQLRSTAGASAATINAANLWDAHVRIEAGHSLGKIVLAGF